MAGNSLKRHMTAVKIKRANKPQSSNSGRSGSSEKFSSYLPAVYTGLGNRTDRYRQYDSMDQDPEINTSLDILTEFCTQNSEDFESPFIIHYKDNQMGETEVLTLENRLDAWDKLNDFTTRIFEIFRGVIKMGDQFFVRDPETFEWIWVDPAHVEKITINESRGKKPVIYFMKDVSLNLKDKVMSNPHFSQSNNVMPGVIPNTLSSGGSAGTPTGGFADTSPYPGRGNNDTIPVDADHVVHISLSNGMDRYAPFGTSILEQVFKTFKQKELLEDSIIIYRVQRAPERRVFKIDVGDMPDYMANVHVERMKNEIHQRRIPTNKGGSSSMMDAAYNPLSILEDFFFPQTADGRGSSVETLPGGDNLGQIDDLRWFNNKLIRGLKIPSSYLPFGPEDTGHVINDGRMGQALIQEHRFNKYCQRLQSAVIKIFDDEFKHYLKESGYQFNFSSFEVRFRPPMNFAAYRKAELESTLMTSYQGLNELPFVAKQTILKKMGWTQEDIIENERLWLQENPDKNGTDVSTSGDSPDLSAVGIDNPSEVSNTDMDSEMPDDMGADSMDSPISGNEQTF